MGAKNDLKCKHCKGKIDEENTGKFHCPDTMRGYTKLNFCSLQCMKSWAVGKFIGMCIALLIGIGLCLDLFINGSLGEKSMAISLLFIPYMIRRLARSSFGILNGGQVKEIIELFLVLILSFTFVYPMIKLVQELVLYIRIFKITDGTEKKRNNTKKPKRNIEKKPKSAKKTLTDNDNTPINNIAAKDSDLNTEPSESETVSETNSETDNLRNKVLAAAEIRAQEEEERHFAAYLKKQEEIYNNSRNANSSDGRNKSQAKPSSAAVSSQEPIIPESYANRRIITNANLRKNATVTDNASSDNIAKKYSESKTVFSESKVPNDSGSEKPASNLSTDKYSAQDEEVSPLTAYYREQEKWDKRYRDYYSRNQDKSPANPSVVTVSSHPTEHKTVYYNSKNKERANPHPNMAIQAKIVDKTRNKTIYIQDNKFQSTEVMFSVLGDTYFIERKEDGFWYLNGAIYTHFDIYLNGVRKIGFSQKLENGDKISLLGVKGKGRSEYHGKTFEYQFFIGN